MVREVNISITKSCVQNLSLPDEWSNRETSRRSGSYIYLVSRQDLPLYLVVFKLPYILTDWPADYKLKQPSWPQLQTPRRKTL